MKRLHVLVGCEYSGVVRDAFNDLGHHATSCDLLPSETDGPHWQGDLLELLGKGFHWDLAIFHPPCTYLSVSGLHWNKRIFGRQEKTEEALNFVRLLLDAPIERIALENPIGCISSRIRKPDQIIHPYQFGDDASKATCLWLKNLPLLQPTEYYPPRIVNGKERWGNQTDSGQNKLTPDKKGFEGQRAKERSRTYEGIAKAMALQWSK